MTEKQYGFGDSGNINKYFVMIPNLVDDLGLDPYAVRLYLHIKRRAGAENVCYESVTSMARNCEMSRTQVVRCKRVLERTTVNGKPLITIEEGLPKKGQRPPHYIRVTDIMLENCRRYNPEVQAVPDVDLGSYKPKSTTGTVQVHHRNSGVPVVDYKKNPLRRTHEEEPGESDEFSTQKDYEDRLARRCHEWKVKHLAGYKSLSERSR